MGKLNKEEMLEMIEENISRLKNKEYTLYFFVLDTKGNPSISLEYIYHTALTLSKRGHNVVMLHQEKDEFIGVEEWLGKEYAELTHMNVDKDNVEVSPSDFLFIPDIFANVMLQTKKLNCKKVAIVQNYGNITEFMPVSQTMDTLGVLDAIVTSEFQKERLLGYFPYIHTHIVHPSIRKVFRDNKNQRKLIINVISREQSDVNKIVKPFYWKNPIYRWVSFRDLRGVSKDVMAEALREGAITIWVDDKTEFGVNLVEAIKCGGIIVGKVPEHINEWMIEDNELTKSVIWFNDIDDVSNMLPSIIRSWTMDEIPQEIYDKQENVKNMFTEEIQLNEIIEVYEKNIINKRLKDFEETKIEIKNNFEKENKE